MGWLVSFQRWMWRIPEPLIGMDEAIEIASAVDRDSVWMPEARLQLRTWKVWLAPGRWRSRVVYVDQQTGEIVGKTRSA